MIKWLKSVFMWLFEDNEPSYKEIEQLAHLLRLALDDEDVENFAIEEYFRVFKIDDVEELWRRVR